MDYSGNQLIILKGEPKIYMIFNDEICYKNLGLSAKDLENDLNNQHQFDNIACDMVDDDIMIYSINANKFIEVLQYIADSYGHESSKEFFKKSGVNKKLINNVSFGGKSSTDLSKETEYKLNSTIQNWKDSIEDFLLANFSWIEYCDIQREASLNNIVCNYIKFPKAENGRNANRTKLQEIIDTIEYTEDLSEKFFGKDHLNVEIMEDSQDIYIVWNMLDSDKYEELSHLRKMLINKFYRF